MTASSGQASSIAEDDFGFVVVESRRRSQQRSSQQQNRSTSLIARRGNDVTFNLMPPEKKPLASLTDTVEQSRKKSLVFKGELSPPLKKRLVITAGIMVMVAMLILPFWRERKIKPTATDPHYLNCVLRPSLAGYYPLEVSQVALILRKIGLPLLSTRSVQSLIPYAYNCSLSSKNPSSLGNINGLGRRAALSNGLATTLEKGALLINRALDRNLPAAIGAKDLGPNLRELWTQWRHWIEWLLVRCRNKVKDTLKAFRKHVNNFGHGMVKMLLG